MTICCGPSYDSECVAASISEQQCLLSPSACTWVCGHAVGTRVILLNQHSGDAGDTAAAAVSSLFTFLFYLCVAGCCCACCGARYCMLKARRNAGERADTGSASSSFWLGQTQGLPTGTPVATASSKPPPPPPEGHVGIYSPPVAVATPLGAAYTKPKALL